MLDRAEFPLALAEAGRHAKKVQSVAPTRNSLVRKGMIYSPAHGDTAFSVPLFDQFLERQHPEFDRI